MRRNAKLEIPAFRSFSIKLNKNEYIYTRHTLYLYNLMWPICLYSALLFRRTIMIGLFVFMQKCIFLNLGLSNFYEQCLRNYLFKDNLTFSWSK